jgi:hypothetical protein
LREQHLARLAVPGRVAVRVWGVSVGVMGWKGGGGGVDATAR